MEQAAANRLTILAALGLIVLSPGLAAAAPAKQAAKPAAAATKATTPGAGKCVFSTEELPKGGEKDYKLSNSFKAGDDIHMRCYFAKTVKEFAKDGKLKNEMRGPIEGTIAAQSQGPAWHSDMTWTDDPLWFFRTRNLYTPSDEGDWTGQRFDQPKTTDKEACDWHDVLGDGGCVDFEQQSLNLAEKLGKTGTYSPQICVESYYNKVDRKKLVNASEVDDVVVGTMARGCFTYTVEAK